MAKLTTKDYRYLYGQLQHVDKKLPKQIYQKVINGEDLTEDEEIITKQIILEDMRKERA